MDQENHTPQVSDQPEKPEQPRRVPDYRARRRFPESGNTRRQWELLLMGCIPLLRYKLRSLFLRLKAPVSNLFARLALPADRRKWATAAVFLVFTLSIAAFAVYRSLYTEATTVMFDGVELGTVASEEEAEAALTRCGEEDYAIIYITEQLAQQLKDELARMGESPLPAVIPIPGVYGNTGMGMRAVNESVIRAVGSDIV